MNVLKTITAAILYTAISTSGAHATYSYYDIGSDVGTYAPIALGDDLTVDACGSTVRKATSVGQTPSEIYNLCTDIPDYSIFSIVWELTFNGVTQTAAYYGANVANGLTLTVGTGAGTVISEAGTYLIGLWVDFDNNSSFQLPAWAPYSTGYTGGDGGYIPEESGYRNIDYSSTSLTVNEAASVPEPYAPFILLPALAYVMRREYRKKQTAENAA